MSTEEREKWDARHALPGYRAGDAPKPWLEAITPRLPSPPGRALDLAAGEGQNAAWLASLGWAVTALDISPLAQRKARILAAEWGASFDYRVADLDTDTDALDHHTWDLITCFHYLNPALAPKIAAALNPGGLVAIELLAKPNAQRHERPSPRYLIDEGALATWFPTLTTLETFEGWEGELYVARVLAQSPPPP